VVTADGLHTQRSSAAFLREAKDAHSCSRCWATSRTCSPTGCAGLAGRAGGGTHRAARPGRHEVAYHPGPQGPQRVSCFRTWRGCSWSNARSPKVVRPATSLSFTSPACPPPRQAQLTRWPTSEHIGLSRPCPVDAGTSPSARTPPGSAPAAPTRVMAALGNLVISLLLLDGGNQHRRRASLQRGQEPPPQASGTLASMHRLCRDPDQPGCSAGLAGMARALARNGLGAYMGPCSSNLTASRLDYRV
jgi:hypothetical protein